jgi:hypothetical protein
MASVIAEALTFVGPPVGVDVSTPAMRVACSVTLTRTADAAQRLTRRLLQPRPAGEADCTVSPPGATPAPAGPALLRVSSRR